MTVKHVCYVQHGCIMKFKTLWTGILRLSPLKPKNFISHVLFGESSACTLCQGDTLWRLHNVSLISLRQWIGQPSPSHKHVQYRCIMKFKQCWIGVAKCRIFSPWDTLWRVYNILGISFCPFIGHPSWPPEPIIFFAPHRRHSELRSESDHKISSLEGTIKRYESQLHRLQTENERLRSIETSAGHRGSGKKMIPVSFIFRTLWIEISLVVTSGY